MKINFTLSVDKNNIEGNFDSKKVIDILTLYAECVKDASELFGFIMITIQRGEYAESRYTEHFSDGKQAVRACRNISNILSVIY